MSELCQNHAVSHRLLMFLVSVLALLRTSTDKRTHVKMRQIRTILEELYLPLGAQTQINACQSLTTTYCCFDKDRGIILWISSIQGWRPVATNSHGLIFSPHPNQELEGET